MGLAKRPNVISEFLQAGAFLKHQGLGRWLAATPQEEWLEDDEVHEMLNERWDESFGDRR